MGSLRVRLLAAAAAWVAIALLLAGWALATLFRAHVEAELAERMRGHLEQLVAALMVGPDGRVMLARELSEPLFRQPASGLYWIVEPMPAAAGAGERGQAGGEEEGQAGGEAGGEAGEQAGEQAGGQASGEGANEPGAAVDTGLRSRSLWDHPLVLPAAPGAVADDGVQRLEAAGPRGQPLVLWAREVRLAGAAAPLRVAVGADTTRQRQMSASFTRTLAGSLAVLGLGLIGAAVLQVQLGLRPLARLHAALQGLRAGRTPRVDGRFPDEVRPLVDELNGLLDENAAIVEHARTQTGNLAHALKTPLAVIANATRELPGPTAALVAEQAGRMGEQVERHLARARSTAAVRGRGPGCAVAPLLEDLRRTVERLHAGRDVALTLEAAPGLRFRGDAADLQEMVGNLLDNAAKWAARRVSIAARREGAQLVVEVGDDGPGIAPADRAAVLERGRRLDETRPGTGLGLAIVDETVRLYGGSLALDTAPEGGLLARLRLPAGPEEAAQARQAARLPPG